MGLGKPRTKLGKWLDVRGIKQEWLIKQSGLGRNTITWACGDPDYVPSGSTMRKILEALRKVDPAVTASTFWRL